MLLLKNCLIEMGEEILAKLPSSAPLDGSVPLESYVPLPGRLKRLRDVAKGGKGGLLLSISSIES